MNAFLVDEHVLRIIHTKRALVWVLQPILYRVATGPRLRLAVILQLIDGQHVVVDRNTLTLAALMILQKNIVSKLVKARTFLNINAMLKQLICAAVCYLPVRVHCTTVFSIRVS